MTKFLLAFLPSFIFVLNVFSQRKDLEYRFGDDISNIVQQEYVKEGLIAKDETILAYCRLVTERYVSNQMPMEMATILTAKRVIDYKHIGEGVMKQDILLNDILNLQLNEERSSVYILITKGVTHNSKFNEDRLESTGSLLVSVMSDKKKGLLFYEMLKKQWEKSPAYSANREVYRQFFDENGDYRPRPSEVRRHEIMEQMQSRLDSAALKTFRNSGRIYYFNKNKIYELNYDIDQEKYMILGLIVNRLKGDQDNDSELFLNYELLIKGKFELPYRSRGTEFQSVKELATDKFKDVLTFLAH